jgi:hypothetical protein
MISKPVEKTQIAYEQERDEWRRLVGTVLLSFGEIELLTMKCLAHLPSDKIADTASRLPFGTRTDLLVEIIEDRYGASGGAPEFVKALKAAKKFAEVRNVLAHNPLQLDIYVNKSPDAVLTELTITRSGKSIDLAAMKEHAASAENLVSELYLAFGKLQAECSNDQAQPDS